MRHCQLSNGTHYHYTAHRMDSVSYDDAISTVYHYNAYGQPDSVYDESGVMCYEYGNMGEVTKETRIYALPFLPQPLALSTLFEYDSWGRILNITYPDNEIVNYDYDLGGQLFRMYNNSSYTYLDNIIYDRFGAKTSQDYGNGIVTQYTYNDTTRRLSEIATNNGALINYTYDLVGNVTQVTSTCPWLQNQSFIENFNYDSADQLTTAQENQNNGYQLTVNYGHWGKVNNYDLAQTDFINNTSTGDSRLFTYPSDPNNLQVAQTMFAPEQCNGTADILFSFGINGSLRKRETTQPQQHIEYYLFNSQGNHKAYSDDIMDFAYYGYNAANTRTYKLSLYNTNLWINGQQQPLNMQLQNAMFYPNTYLNFNGNGEYTKHYYNGTERIASRLGDNTTTIALNNNILEARKLQLEEQFREDIHKLIEETVPIDLPPFIDVNALQPTGTPNDIYYYHPNHLGSTSFVTDNNATITQGFLYAPFGEITTEYNINFGNNVIPKYSFNAKELDEETGMYYYEARYYKPPVFTSRDPMFEKYFWMTPYAYCANNPVKYVDPSGKAYGDYYSTSGQFLYNDGTDDKKIYEVSSLPGFDYNIEGSGVTIITYVGQVTDVKMTFTGSANGVNPALAEGQVEVIQIGSNGKEYTRINIDAVAGPYGNGAPENGDYTVDTPRIRSESGYKSNGVGFSFNLNPKFNTSRDLLRIHPDGNKKGTLGCIGLIGTTEELNDFYKFLKLEINNNGAVNMNINIQNNPNNAGGGAIPNVNE